MIEKALAENWDEVLEYLKNSKPQVYDSFFDTFICDYKNGEYPDDLKEWGMTETQKELMRWLDSSERRTEYYNSIPEDEMTDYDWADLKASAW